MAKDLNRDGDITDPDETFTYDSSQYGPHAVYSADGKYHKYDANGNMVQRIDHSETGSNYCWEADWRPFNKPAEFRLYHTGSFTTPDTVSRFTYGADHQRLTQKVQEGGAWARMMLYAGALEIERRWDADAPDGPDSAAAVHYDDGQGNYGTYQAGDWAMSFVRVAISSPAGVVGTITLDPDSSAAEATQRHLFLKDHLGSIAKVLNWDADPASSTYLNYKTVEHTSYGTWGERRDANEWSLAHTSTLPSDPATRRGYTGHEMLDEVGLIHMNGRIYDPLLGRFLSADPFVQEDGNLQNYNRYSYVLNNPLSMTDPSGYFFKKLFGIVVSLVVGIVTMGIASAIFEGIKNAVLFGALTGAVSGFAAGFAGGLASGGGISGALRGGLMGGISGGIAGGIGGHFGHGFDDWGQAFAKALSHGVSQGAISEAFGGDFGSGFLGGFGGSMFASLGGSLKDTAIGKHLSIPDDATWQQKVIPTMAAAAVGGTVAEISSGSFANGAFSAAFVALYNDGGGRSESLPDHKKKILAKTRVLEKQKQGLLTDMTELENLIIKAERLSAAHQVLHEGIQLGAVAAKGFSVVKGLVRFSGNVLRGEVGRFLFKRSTASAGALNSQIARQEITTAGGEVLKEGLSFGIGYAMVESQSLLSEGFNSGRGSINDLYRTAAQLERQYHEVNHRLENLRNQFLDHNDDY